MTETAVAGTTHTLPCRVDWGMAVSLSHGAISSAGSVSAAVIDQKNISLNPAGALLGYRVNADSNRGVSIPFSSYG